jgi:hypothetical protein
MATIYGEQLQDLLTSIAQYSMGRLHLAELKNRIWTTAQTISSYEERDLRKFLQWAEGQLDMVQFTRDADNVFSASLDIVRVIEDRVRDALD